MQSKTFRAAGLIAAISLAAGAALAQDAGDDAVIFENAVDPSVVDAYLDPAGALAVDRLYTAWNLTREAYASAEAAGADPADLLVLAAAVEASGTAYETALVAQNSVMMADLGMQPLDDATIVELFEVPAE
ncbi:MAG: hypothetical protein AAF914_08015 [Pseudomonadota bacterium]